MPKCKMVILLWEFWPDSLPGTTNDSHRSQQVALMRGYSLNHWVMSNTNNIMNVSYLNSQSEHIAAGSRHSQSQPCTVCFVCDSASWTPQMLLVHTWASCQWIPETVHTTKLQQLYKQKQKALSECKPPQRLISAVSSYLILVPTVDFMTAIDAR